MLAAITVPFHASRSFGLNRVTAWRRFFTPRVAAVRVSTKEPRRPTQFLAIHRAIYLLILNRCSTRKSFVREDVCRDLLRAGMSLFFVGKLRPQDVTGNLLALASGFCFACYFLLLRHTKARAVNRASSVIYGNLLLVVIAAPAALKVLPHISKFDAAGIVYLGVVQIGVAYTVTLAMAPGFFT